MIMQYIYSILLTLFGSLFLGEDVFCQSHVQILAEYFSKSSADYPSELVYFQTSKGIYETGEDLWFKAYQFDAQTFGLSDKSQTLYLQMINPKDSVVWEEKYPIVNGITSGHIYVNEKLPEGNYFLTGYAKHSFYKNDSIGIISTRKVKIIKNIARNESSVLPHDSVFRFDTFPEGGNLVDGIATKLAFKATDGKGNPLEIAGTLYQEDKPLSEIKSTHDGMGVVLFSPLLGKNYKIVLNNGRNYPLPDIQSEGMVMRLSRHDKEQLDFIVSQSERLPDQQIYLMGQMRGIVCCIAKGVLKDNLKITIPLSNFIYQGIAEFTLYNEQLQPVSERLVYIHPGKQLKIVAEPEKKSFLTRERVSVKIKVTDDNGKPVRANLGISVYDQAYDNLADPINMLNYCYLSSQIRGRIHDPAYYFDEKNKDRTEALDLLLLTQGWRRYIWNMGSLIQRGQLFLTDEINGMQVLGTKRREKQKRNLEQLIRVSGSESNSMFVWADSIGQFTVKSDIMKELRGGYVYLKPMVTNGFKPKLEIKDWFSTIDSLRKNRQDYYPFVDLVDYRKNVVLDLPVISNDSTILLGEVTVVGKGRKTFRDKFMGHLDSLAQMNFGPWVCEHDFLEDYKPGYTHHHNPVYCPCPNQPKERKVPIIGKRYHLIKPRYYECTSGCCFTVEDRQTIIYEGADYSEEELLRMNNLWRTKGYYTNREFYQPDELDMQSAIPDARNTLLWQPSVITDEKGEATVSFYCSDINTGFIGLVEGVDGVGLLGSTKCEFRVIRR